MTLFMPPIQRKKKNDEKYNPDSFRVMSEDAVSDHPKFRPLTYRASFEPRTPTPKAPTRNNNAFDGEACEPSAMWEPLKPLKNTRVLPQILPDHRANNPQTRACGFLDKNVRFLNEPICNVYTAPVQNEEKQWWPARANPGELVIPPYAEDTHYRNDYNYRHGERPTGSGRHTSNQNREAALGTVPVNLLRENDGSQRLYKEGVSYEHNYNSRTENGYPIRGKVRFADEVDGETNSNSNNIKVRQGAFVWSRMDPLSQKKFVDYYQRLEEQERQLCAEGALSARENGNIPIVVRSNNNCNNKSGNGTPRRGNSSVTIRSEHSAVSKKSGTSIPLEQYASQKYEDTKDLLT